MLNKKQINLGFHFSDKTVLGWDRTMRYNDWVSDGFICAKGITPRKTAMVEQDHAGLQDFVSKMDKHGLDVRPCILYLLWSEYKYPKPISSIIAMCGSENRIECLVSAGHLSCFMRHKADRFVYQGGVLKAFSEKDLVGFCRTKDMTVDTLHTLETWDMIVSDMS